MSGLCESVLETTAAVFFVLAVLAGAALAVGVGIAIWRFV
jgi:hypothetical protein